MRVSVRGLANTHSQRVPSLYWRAWIEYEPAKPCFRASSVVGQTIPETLPILSCAALFAVGPADAVPRVVVVPIVPAVGAGVQTALVPLFAVVPGSENNNHSLRIFAGRSILSPGCSGT